MEILNNKLTKYNPNVVGFPTADWEDFDCKFCDKKNKVCKFASEAAGKPVETDPYNCTICIENATKENIKDNPLKIPRIQKMIYEADKEKYNETYNNVELILGEGVGTELHKLIPKFLDTGSCNCKKYAKKMNIWGVEGCKKRFDEITAYLLNKANDKPIFSWVPNIATATVVKKLLTTAIERANKNVDLSWMVAVTTAPRKDQTLSACLDSLTVAGFEPYIFAEPNTEVPIEYQDRTIIHEERKGVWWNWIESCRYALNNSNAEKILTVQDDSIFHPDCQSFMNEHLWPSSNVGFVSLYTPKHYSVQPRKRSAPRNTGINRIHTKSLWGACALVWPRKVLEKVMEHELIENWYGCPTKTKSIWEERLKQRKAEPWRIQNSDTAIGKIVNRMKREMWFVDPSPVQHIAQHSAIGHGGNKGRRNCGRCAKYSVPLSEQVPIVCNGNNEYTQYTYNEISI